MGILRTTFNSQPPPGATESSPTSIGRTRGAGGATGVSLLGAGRGTGAVPVYTVFQGLQNRRGRDCVSATGDVYGGERKDTPGMSPVVLSAGLLDWIGLDWTKASTQKGRCYGGITTCAILFFYLFFVERTHGVDQHAHVPGN